jgi:hypothetical protein
MSKRPRAVDYEKRWSQGQGQGSEASYQPWLRIQDVASKGKSSRPKGWKTQRIHHLLSDLESKFFHVLE